MAVFQSRISSTGSWLLVAGLLMLSFALMVARVPFFCLSVGRLLAQPAVDDAIGFAKILNDPERCADPTEQVSLLTQKSAKRDDILAALDRLAQSTTPDSTAIIYFSGHGYQVESPTGEAYYLMPFGYDVNRL
jgi:hypothetical protein